MISIGKNIYCRKKDYIIAKTKSRQNYRASHAACKLLMGVFNSDAIIASHGYTSLHEEAVNAIISKNNFY